MNQTAITDSMSRTSIELMPIAPATSATVVSPRAKSPVTTLRHNFTSSQETGGQTRQDGPEPNEDQSVDVTRWQTFATIMTVSGVTGIGGLCSGIVIVAIPAIAADIKLESSLLMWLVIVLQGSDEITEALGPPLSILSRVDALFFSSGHSLTLSDRD